MNRLVKAARMEGSNLEGGATTEGGRSRGWEVRCRRMGSPGEGATPPYGEHDGNWSDSHGGGSEDGVGCVEEKEKGRKESGVELGD
jgi:hypothetical protein